MQVRGMVSKSRSESHAHGLAKVTRAGLGAVCAHDVVIKRNVFSTISKVTDPDFKHFDENTLLENRKQPHECQTTSRGITTLKM